MDIRLAYDLHQMKKLSKVKIIIILVSAFVLFFVITFFQKWGVTVAEKATSDYSAKVKSIKNDYKKAAKVCPKIIKSLKDGIPELEKNKLLVKLNLSYKLIADCEAASLHHEDAANYYAKLVVSEPQVARWHVAYAESLYKAGNAAEALRPAHLATQLEPKKYEFRLLEARLLAKLNQAEKAIEAYEKTLKLAPINQIQRIESERNRLISLLQESVENTQNALNHSEIGQ